MFQVGTQPKKRPTHSCIAVAWQLFKCEYCCNYKPVLYEETSHLVPINQIVLQNKQLLILCKTSIQIETFYLSSTVAAITQEKRD